MGHLYGLSLSRAILSDTAMVFVHGSFGGHAIKFHRYWNFLTLSLFVSYFAFTFLMPCKHSAEHHKIRATAERLRDVTRYRAASIGAYVPVKAVGSVSAFDNSCKLRITDPGQLSRGANGTRTDADSYDISAREYECLSHFGGYNIARHDDSIRVVIPSARYRLQEGLGISVCDININFCKRHSGLNMRKFLYVFARGSSCIKCILC